MEREPTAEEIAQARVKRFMGLAGDLCEEYLIARISERTPEFLEASQTRTEAILKIGEKWGFYRGSIVAVAQYKVKEIDRKNEKRSIRGT